MNRTELERRLEKLFSPPPDPAPLDFEPLASPPAADSLIAPAEGLVEPARAPGAGAPDPAAPDSELFKSVFDQIPDAVFIKDRSHKWVAVNAAFCEWIGQPAEQLLGKTEYDFLPAARADDAWQLDNRVFATGQPNTIEIPVDTRVWRIQRQPLPGQSGPTHYLVGVVQDITATRQAETALHESEKQHRNERRQWEERLRRLKRGLLFQFGVFGALAGLTVSAFASARPPDGSGKVYADAPEPSVAITPTSTLAATSAAALPALPAATDTPSPSPTPTALRPSVSLAPTFAPQAIVISDTVIAPPAPAPLRQFGPNVVNIILMGSDRRPGDGAWRTDVLILVSVDPEAPSITMLSFPRDLWVYIPGWRWQRINLADERGETAGFPGGGPALVKQTIQYNFGIPVHYYARVDFGGYKRLIDSVGGVDVVADCPLVDIFPDVPDGQTDIISGPDLSTVLTGTIDIPIAGVYHLDGKHALWYSRSRKTTSDFDRSRRQQRVLRAVWDEIRRQGLLGQAPALWETLTQSVETDLTLNDVLYLAEVGSRLGPAHIRSRFIDGSMLTWHVTETGASVLRYSYDEIAPYLDEAFAPLPRNIAAQAPALIEVLNGTHHPDWERVAADRLGWAGFGVSNWGKADSISPRTTIVDFTSTAKGSRLSALVELFGVSPDNVLRRPDPDSPVAYRVIVGEDYEPCQPPSRGRWPAPPPTPASTPQAAPAP
jgi:LCP family protein required for cell wall assembly/PAS domain S-box-containing protein